MDLFEDMLIELVRDYPSLYKNKDKKHKSIIVKEKCWQEIGEKLNKSPEECKNKWRNIRDNYKKNLNKKKTGASCYGSKYDDVRLKFLDGCFVDKECLTSLNTRNVLEVDEEDNMFLEICPEPSTSAQIALCDPLSQPSQVEERKHSITLNLSQDSQDTIPEVIKRRKRNQLVDELRRNRLDNTKMLRKITEKDTSPVHVFFRSMADVVCQFPPDKIAQIRSQVCNLVTEMELSVLSQRDAAFTQNSFNVSQPIQAYNCQPERISPQHSAEEETLSPQHLIKRETPSP